MPPLCRTRTIHHEVVPGNDRSSHARQIETYFKQMLQECNDDASSIVNRLTDAADGARGSALPGGYREASFPVSVAKRPSAAKHSDSLPSDFNFLAASSRSARCSRTWVSALAMLSGVG